MNKGSTQNLSANDHHLLAVWANHVAVVGQAQALAELLQAPLLSPEQHALLSNYRFYLHYLPAVQQADSSQALPSANSSITSDYCLALSAPGEKFKPMVIDFMAKDLQQRVRRAQMSPKSELLLRAVGLRKERTIFVYDCTAGLGRDAYLMAKLGCQVTMCERNPVLAALLQDGLRRLQRAETLSLCLQQGEAQKILAQQTAFTHAASAELRCQSEAAPNYTVIYMDPMFPAKQKSAKVHKGMQLLQMLVGADQDEADLLQQALNLNVNRVVMKRPRLSPALSKPAFCYEGQACRFDVYIPSTSPNAAEL